MPTVLLTGASGKIGRVVAARLARDGWQVRPFDLATGGDLRDEAAVRLAAAGCDAIVHAGAIAHDTRGSVDEIVATNVLGTWHVLRAAERPAVARVVVFSSVQVFGYAEGAGEPLYLPVDDDHPLRATRPYGMSKRLVEEMCATWTTRTGLPTVVLRPVLVVDDHDLAHLQRDRLELDAFVHVNDVAAAVAQSLRVPVNGHVRVTLCGAGSYDTTRALQVLGWTAIPRVIGRPRIWRSRFWRRRSR